MNTISRTITGIVIIVVGIVMARVAWADPAAPAWVGVLFALAGIALGVYIFFNTREDDIEGITDTTHTSNK